MLRLFKWPALIAVLALVGSISAHAQTAFPTPQGSRANGAVIMCPSAANAALFKPCDVTNPLAINGSISAVTSATATAAAPSYVEGSTNPLSMDLSGGIRITGTISATSAATATAAAPSYMEGASSALSQNLTGDQRVIAKQSGTWTVQPGNTANTTAWKVDGSAVTQPVSAASLPLPALAATSTKQSDGSQKSQIVDGSGNVIGATSNALDVNIKSGAGSGGTAIADGATFTEATTSFTPIGGEYVSGGGANCTTGKGCTVQMTIDRMAYANIGKINGVAPLMGAGATGTGSPRVTAASDSPEVTALGAVGDAAWVSGNGSTISVLKNIANGVAGAIPAGTNIIGKVGIDQTTPGTTNGVQVNAALPAGTNIIGTVGALTYPVGATAITASATGTTGATTATLAGTSGKTTYICGYSIRANATANTNVTNTITGVITATLSSIMWVPANTAGLGVDEQIFSPCIPASATNTGIAIVSGAPGAGGLVSSKGWGYQL